MNIQINSWTLKRLAHTVLATVCVLSLSSCGGGGSLASGVDSGGTGITNTVVSGPISGLGSAIVNGIRFDVSSASIVDDQGNPVTADQISLGQMARLESATVDTSSGSSLATAVSIQIRSQLVGLVDSVDLTANTLVAMGQSVLITPATWIDPALVGGFSSNLVGSVVEVYGQFDAARNQYIATRIAQHLDHTAFKLSGLLTSIDSSSKTLNVGGLTVSYAMVPALNLPVLAVGDLIRVRLAVTPVSMIWRALSVSIGHMDLPDRHDVRMTGRITAWTSTRLFHVDGIRIVAKNAIILGTESAIALGARVTVNGLASKGELIATDVDVIGDESVQNSAYELHGAITTLDTLQKTMQIHGVNVLYSSQTQFTTGSASDLLLAKKVKVVGTISSDKSSLDAKQITFE